MQRWLDNRRTDDLPKIIRQQFIGGVCPHAACVGSLIPIEYALVIACRGKWRIPLSVGKNDERKLFAFQRLLQEDSPSAWPEFVFFHQAFDKVFRGGEVWRQEYALAGTQSVRLNHNRPSHGTQRAVNIGGRVIRAVYLCRGNAMPSEKLFRENFASFELGGLLRRANNSPIPSSKRIRQPIHQRQFRSHNGQIGMDFLGKRDDRANVSRVDGQALRFRSDTTIPGGTPDFFYARALF